MVVLLNNKRRMKRSSVQEVCRVHLSKVEENQGQECTTSGLPGTWLAEALAVILLRKVYRIAGSCSFLRSLVSLRVFLKPATEAMG